MSAASSSSEPRSSTVSRDVAGRLINVTPKRLDQLVGEGWIRRAGRNEYAVVDVVQGYIRFLRDGLERKDERNAEPNALIEGRIREIELRIEERDKRLIDRKEHDEILDALIGMIGEGISTFPAMAARNADEKRNLENRIASILDRVAAKRLALDQTSHKFRKGGGQS